MYPMWGPYHTRWWLTEKIVGIAGMGIFKFNNTKAMYYRLMGAKIGRNVEFEGAKMVGKDSYIGSGSIVAAGSKIAPITAIGYNSSSWEMQDADEANRNLASGLRKKPRWAATLFITFPILIFAWVVSLAPWVAGLVGMVSQAEYNDKRQMRDVLDWFTTPHRIAFHYLALSLRVGLTPFVVFALTLLFKGILDLMFGKLPSISTPESKLRGVDVWRISLMKALFPVSNLHQVTTLFGQHYEATSIALRLLGAKVGKSVYWPGTGPARTDYHLIDVGNEVVFGSRSRLITSDGYGSAKIKIGDRSMIADRVSLLPGVEIGYQTTMGSGAVTRRDTKYNSHGVYFGSKGGDSVCLSAGYEEPPKLSSRLRRVASIRHGKSGEAKPMSSSASTTTFIGDTSTEKDYKSGKKVVRHTYFRSTSSGSSITENGMTAAEDMSPFGRAFYLRKAPYYVFGQFFIFLYSSFMRLFSALYWNVSNVSAVIILKVILDTNVDRDDSIWKNAGIVLGCIIGLIAVISTIQAFLALAIVIIAKWVVIGRRRPGNYDWDQSPYCQRWQLFLNIERLRRDSYRGGALNMLTGTRYIVWYFQLMGAKMGKDVTLLAASPVSC
ncbi:hypothetical protein NLG97_g1410 [Lecanicillium saksenae]|uniref:Uncharacterized protein n=1 Tax=Lecanicillium saksenae TaxID=468837 RepID=A0ACC1R590_9HYPO|nr:hypothetical protein NLG97_g1410 [Lecanicillium saksenae]